MTDLDKTFEQLDKTYWGEISPDNTGLTNKILLLRKKPLKHFDIGDLRLMIGQSFYLDYLIPMAIEKLQENSLAEGDYYEGDLLKSVLDSDPDFWIANKDHWSTMIKIYEANKALFDADNSYRQIRKSFERFKSINVC
jgi:hypothetical protein